MYTGLKHLHHYLPYLIIALLLITLVALFMNKIRGNAFGPGSKKLALFSLIACHIQLVVGLILYGVSPLVSSAYGSGELMSNSANRFVAIEHPITMILAIVLITIGYSKAKRKTDDSGKYKSLISFYLIGLILILLRMPWDIWPA